MRRRTLRFEHLEDRSMLSILAGTVFDDANASGARDAGESGLAGWTAFLDQSGDSTPGDFVTTKVQGGATCPEMQTTLSLLSVSGMQGSITDLDTTVTLSGTVARCVIVTLTSPAGTTVTLAHYPGTGVRAGFADTVFDDEAIALIANGTDPFTGRYVPTESLTAFDGQSANGTWTLAVTINGSGIGAGNLTAWSLGISTPEPVTTTDANGAFSFDVAPGTWTVKVANQANWAQTMPMQPSYYQRTVAAGATVNGLDFGEKFYRPQQIIGTEGAQTTAVTGSAISVPITYTTSNADATLAGVAVRVHFNSALLSFVATTNLAPNLLQSQVPADDTSDYDGDPATDKYVLVGWFDVSGSWPGTVPMELATCSFNVVGAVSQHTNVRFSCASHAAGYGFTTYPIDYAVLAVNYDVDGNMAADALTDGMLILRYMLDPTGPWDVMDALGTGATRTTRATIGAFLDTAGTILDVDGNGMVNALSDGWLIMRYLMDRINWPATDGVDEGATRTTRAQLQLFMDAATLGV